MNCKPAVHGNGAMCMCIRTFKHTVSHEPDIKPKLKKPFFPLKFAGDNVRQQQPRGEVPLHVQNRPLLLLLPFPPALRRSRAGHAEDEGTCGVQVGRSSRRNIKGLFKKYKFEFQSRKSLFEKVQKLQLVCAAQYLTAYAYTALDSVAVGAPAAVHFHFFRDIVETFAKSSRALFAYIIFPSLCRRTSPFWYQQTVSVQGLFGGGSSSSSEQQQQPPVVASEVAHPFEVEVDVNHRDRG